MNATVAGLMTGLALGFAGYFGGFGALVVVAVVGLAGLIVGWLARHDGRVAEYLRSRSRDGRGIRETLGHAGGSAERRTPPERPRSTSAAAPRTRRAQPRRSGPAPAPRPEQRTRVH
jgi:hypothetical protein